MLLRFAPVRRDDRRRHADQQDGAGAAQGLRPDAGARYVISRWAAANGGGYYHYSYSVVHAAATASCRSTSMPGCPPTGGLIYGVLLQKKIRAHRNDRAVRRHERHGNASQPGRSPALAARRSARLSNGELTLAVATTSSVRRSSRRSDALQRRSFIDTSGGRLSGAREALRRRSSPAVAGEEPPASA